MSPDLFNNDGGHVEILAEILTILRSIQQNGFILTDEGNGSFRISFPNRLTRGR